MRSPCSTRNRFGKYYSYMFLYDLFNRRKPREVISRGFAATTARCHCKRSSNPFSRLLKRFFCSPFVSAENRTPISIRESNEYYYITVCVCVCHGHVRRVSMNYYKSSYNFAFVRYPRDIILPPVLLQ